jgi:hypothetical protein
MAFTVEDGTGVEDANSYVTVAELRAYAGDRGVALPVADASVEYLLVKAADHLETREYIGTVEFTDQGLKFPRLVTDETGTAVSSGVPVSVKRAQKMLALEAQNGALDIAARSGKYKRTKIDQIYVEYRNAFEVAFGFAYPAVDAALKPWLSMAGRLFNTVRA